MNKYEDDWKCPRSSNHLRMKSTRRLDDDVLFSMQKGHKCNKCQRIFSRLSSMSRHKCYECPNCHQIFKRTDRLSIHSTGCNSSSMHKKMDNINKPSDNKNILAENIKLVQTSNNEDQSLTNELRCFSNDDNNIKPSTSEANTLFFCPLCLKSFEFANYYTHLKKCQSGEITRCHVVCHICKTKCFSMNEFADHFAAQHDHENNFENLIFDTIDGMKDYMNNLSQATGYSYIIRKSGKNIQSHYYFYTCKSQIPPRKSVAKIYNSHKTNTSFLDRPCTSFGKGYIKSNGSVEFTINHAHNHEPKPECIRISNKTKDKIVQLFEIERNCYKVAQIFKIVYSDNEQPTHRNFFIDQDKIRYILNQRKIHRMCEFHYPDQQQDFTQTGLDMIPSVKRSCSILQQQRVKPVAKQVHINSCDSMMSLNLAHNNSSLENVLNSEYLPAISIDQ